MPLRLLLADEHQMVRQGLRLLLEKDAFEIVAEAGNGQEAVSLAGKTQPDVAVLAVSMPELSGIDAAHQILKERNRVGVVLMAGHVQEQLIVTALRAGIRGYIVTTQGAAELVHAIREVASGGRYLSPTVSSVVVDAYLSGGDVEPDPLTSRERQVIQLVAEGKTTKEIATIMALSDNTVESYRARLMSKLNIHHTAGLVRYAIRRGMILASIGSAAIEALL
jgi:DNA-binding NarL/FixJ family response regulator